MNFSERLESVVVEKESSLMLGLDPNPEKMPNNKIRAEISDFALQFGDAEAVKSIFRILE